MNPKTKSKGLTRYQKGLDRALRRVERNLLKSLTRELVKDFDDLGDVAAQAFMHKHSFLEVTHMKSIGLKSDEDDAARIVASIDFEGWTKKRLQKTLERSASRTYTQVRSTVDDILRIEVDPAGTLEHRITDDLGTRKGLVDIKDGTKKAIVRAIEQGRTEAMSTEEIANLIKREVPKGRFVNAGKKYRAEMIARTETRFGVNKSSMELYRNAPEISDVVAIDGEDDPECSERNGTQYTFAEAEAEDAKTHPNCTLRWVPVVTGEQRK